MRYFNLMAKLRSANVTLIHVTNYTENSIANVNTEISLISTNTPDYLVGPYYAGPKSTPALIPPRANFYLPPFRAAFNATIGKNQKNQKKGKVFNNNYFVFNVFVFPPNKVFDDKVPSVGLLL